MRKLKLTKAIASTLMVISILALNPVGASAEWKQDSKGWWYTEGSGYIKNTWSSIEGKWYYFDENGYMMHDTTIDGYKIGSDGAWINESSSTFTLEKAQEKAKNITYAGGESTNYVVPGILYDEQNKPYYKVVEKDKNGKTIVIFSLYEDGSFVI